MKYFKVGSTVIISNKENKNFGKFYTIIGFTNDIDRKGREYCLYNGTPYKVFAGSEDITEQDLFNLDMFSKE
jgi:hypothetical protein